MNVLRRLFASHVGPDAISQLRALGFDCEEPHECDGFWRCGERSRLCAVHDAMVYVPDGVTFDTPLTLALRVNRRWNKTSSGWCTTCAARLLKNGDASAEIARIEAERRAARVDRLAKHGEEAASQPSQTRCSDCDGLAGFIPGNTWTFGGSYRAVMCPRCGWLGWQKTSNEGLRMCGGFGE